MPYTDGDDWPNEGTGGAALDGVPSDIAPVGVDIAPSFYSPDDGLPAVRFWDASTNEGTAGAAQLNTPHTSGMDFDDGFLMIVNSRSIPDAASHGADQSVRVRVCSDETEEFG